MELSIEANTSASHDSVVMIPNKFYYPKTFLLPKRLFGSNDEEVSVLIMTASNNGL